MLPADGHKLIQTARGNDNIVLFVKKQENLLLTNVIGKYNTVAMRSSTGSSISYLYKDLLSHCPVNFESTSEQRKLTDTYYLIGTLSMSKASTPLYWIHIFCEYFNLLS